MRAGSDEFEGTPTIWTYVQFTGVILLVTYMFFRLGRLMSEFLKGRYFSKAAVQHMRVVAAIYLANALYTFADSKYQIVQNGNHDDLWNVSGDDILGIMLSMTFLIIAHVLNEARKNRDELEDYF